MIENCLVLNNLPKICDTCLYSLMILFSKYPRFLSEKEFNPIFNWIVENMKNVDSIIFLRIATFFYSIVKPKVYFKLTSSIRQKIVNSFDTFVELVNHANSLPDSSVEDDIIASVYFPLGLLIDRAIKENSFGLQPLNFIQNQIDLLNSFTSSPMNLSIKKVKSIINFLTKIINFKQKILNDFNEPVLNAFSALITSNSLAFENALIGVGIIIKSIDCKDKNILVNVNNLIDIAMNSKNQSIIANAIYIRSVLYSIFIKNRIEGYEEFLNKFQSYYTTICSTYLFSTEISLDLRCIIIKSLALLIDSCSDFIQMSQQEMVDVFIQNYTSLSELPVGVKDKSEREIASNFYDAMFSFAAAVIKSIPSQYMKNRKLFRLFMDGIPQRFYNDLVFYQPDQCFISFFNFLRQFNSTFGSAANIIMHRRHNFNICAFAMCSKSPTVENMAIEIVNMLRYS